MTDLTPEVLAELDRLEKVTEGRWGDVINGELRAGAELLIFLFQNHARELIDVANYYSKEQSGPGELFPLPKIQRLDADNQKLRDMLLQTAVSTDYDSCNNCGRKFGWGSPKQAALRRHCAYCGGCLAAGTVCAHPNCELARLLR